MGWDIATCTHPGRHRENRDSLGVWDAGARCVACVCDGIGDADGDRASRFCVRAILEGARVMPGNPTPEALTGLLDGVQRALVAEKARGPGLGRARSTAVVAVLENKRLVWGSVGDSRLYLFRGMERLAASPDDSAAYAEYRRGNLSYGGIRMAGTRGTLTACLGDEQAFAAHAGEEELEPGDGVLLCSDGFWQYVLEGEMGVDLCKSKTAEEWLARMLNRLVGRSMLDGDNLSAIACRVARANEGEGEPHGD